MATVIDAMHGHQRQLDTSVGVSGPRDFTVRAGRTRQRGGIDKDNHDFGKYERGIFAQTGLDWLMALDLLAKRKFRSSQAY
ncbi:hypothetical protein [Bradyrhizobium sp. HKCCYLRH1030]|uniref:hypothetical protein n=1 Tax=Bradyrhizobium sp. HKCCYLRH1030 TaxID=3420744 RepID=UPI003EBDFB10